MTTVPTFSSFSYTTNYAAGFAHTVASDVTIAIGTVSCQTLGVWVPYSPWMNMDGVPMTYLGSSYAVGSRVDFVSMFYKILPAVGSRTVNGSLYGGTTTQFLSWVSCRTYKGVDVVNPFRSGPVANGGNKIRDISISVPSEINDLAVDACQSRNSPYCYQTLESNYPQLSRKIATAPTTTMTWGGNGASYTTVVLGIAMRPTPDPVLTNPKFFLFL